MYYPIYVGVTIVTWFHEELAQEMKSAVSYGPTIRLDMCD
jgi:hypothetical protein